MKKPSTPTLLVLFCLLTQFVWANTYQVTNNLYQGPGSMSDAIQAANLVPSTNANPHIIEICNGGDYGMAYLPTQPMVINGPKDNSMILVQQLYFNNGQSLSGKHFTFNNIVFAGNCCSSFGSAFMSSNGGGTSIFNNCIFRDNDATYQAGGLFNNGDSIVLNGCTFTNNTTSSTGGEGGAAAFNNGGYMRIVNCTFSNNSTVSASGTGGGGAVKNHAGGYMEVINSTFYHNYSLSTGGGLSNGGNSGTCYIANNIFVGNTAGTGGNDLMGTFESAYGHNIIGDVNGATLNGTTTGNVTGVTAAAVIDTVLRNNGHYLPSHALVAGSAAIDAADAGAAPATDEHTFSRTGAADIGAVEYNGVNPCAGFSVSISDPLPGCIEVENTFTATTSGGAAVKSGYWFDGYTNFCGETHTAWGNGTFIYTVTDVNNCVAKDTVITNYYRPEFNYTYDVCPGTPVTHNDSTIVTNGYFQLDYGCDSVVYVTVNYNNATQIDYTYNICGGDTVFGGQHFYTTTGSYNEYYGCDSVVHIDVIVAPLPVPVISLSQGVSCLGGSDAEIALSGTAMSVLLNSQTYAVGAQQFWADTVEDVSTEYTTSGNWSAEQTLGAPNTYPNYGDISTAWTPETYGEGRDFIVVGYDSAIVANRVLVYQTNAPGLIDTVFVRDATNGTWHNVYTATAQNGPQVATILTVNLPGTMSINGVRLEISTDIADDWMEIDAIGLERDGNTVITGLSAGVLNYEASNSDGCTYTGSYTIPNGTPIALQVSADTAICAGNSVALIVSGANTYVWSTSATTSAITVTPANTASYGVTGTAANGCIGYDTVVVTVNQLPQITVNIPQAPLCAGMDTIINLQGGLPAGGIYSGSIVSNNAVNLLNAAPGNYTINYSYTDTNGCSNSGTALLTIQVCGGILETANTIQMDLFPNPAMQQVTVRASDINGKVMLRATDLTGQILLQRELNASGNMEQFISVAEWPAGMYQIQLTNGDYTATQRLVVAR
ncbi:MAG: choice-of-anchor Q domain-containing protein [Chitinophagales bacterium]